LGVSAKFVNHLVEYRFAGKSALTVRAAQGRSPVTVR